MRNGLPVSGKTASTVVLSNVTTNDAGSYTVAITNAYGSVTSGVATLWVGYAPAITSQPTNQSVVAGSTVNLRVAAMGTAPLSYQWQKNGAALTGQTDAALTFANVTTSDNGNYTVLVTNSYGSVTSGVAVLAVVLTITQQPLTQWVGVGSDAVFAVAATGTAPVSYQWLWNGIALSNGGNVSGASSSTLSLSPAGTNDAGRYMAVVSNAYGSLTSSVATLSMGYAPAITTQPTNHSVFPGNPAAFSVSASGTEPFSYQWSKDGAALPSQTSNSLNLSSVTEADAGNYAAVVSSPYGSATSSVAVLIVLTPPAILEQPANQFGAVGSNVTFTVSARGTAPLDYQWLKNGTNLVDGGSVSGAVSNVLTLMAVTTNEAGDYLVLVANAYGSVTSRVATLRVGYAPGILLQPTNLLVMAGNTAGFRVDCAGTEPLGYQWLKDGTNLTETANVSGTIIPLLLVLASSAADAGDYTVVITNFYGSVTSAPATLTVAYPPALVSGPANRVVVAGATAVLSVTATGTQPLTFAWMKDGSPASGPNISGANSNVLTVSSASTNDVGNYWVVVSNPYGAVTSSVVTLTVALYIAGQPSDVAVLAGANALFSVGAVGAVPVSFQWMKNGTNIANGGSVSGAKTSLLYVGGAGAADAATYSVVISCTYGNVTSRLAQLSVLLPPTIFTQPAGQSIACGSNVVFIVSAAGTEPLRFQWRKDGSDISGATTNALAVAGVTTNDAGKYTVVVTNTFGCLTSGIATLTVLLEPATVTFPCTRAIQSWMVPAGTGEISVNLTGGAGGGSNGAPGGRLQASYPVTPGATLHFFVGGAGDASGGYNGGGASPSFMGVAGGGGGGSDIRIGGTDLSNRVLVAGGGGGGGYWTGYEKGGPGGGLVGGSANVAPNLPYPATGGTQTSGGTGARDGFYIYGQNGGLGVGGNAFGRAGGGGGGYYGGGAGYQDGGGGGSSYSAPAAFNVIHTQGDNWGDGSIVISYAPPWIVNHPTSQTVLAGSNARLLVLADGALPLSYQWQKGGTNLSNGGSVFGATSNLLTLPAVTGDSAGAYTVVVTNAQGVVTSLPAILTVDQPLPPAIIVQPASQTVTGGCVTFSVTATGNSTLNYTWLKDGTQFASGTLDNSFDPNANGTVNVFLLQPDGKIVVGGSFTSVGGAARNRIARITAGGTADSGFNPNVGGTVNTLVQQTDGKIVVGGSFTSVGGTVRNQIARLSADGTLDSSFDPNASSMISALVQQTDGKIVVGGVFTSVGGATRNRIARLNASGTADSSFDPNANSAVSALLLQPDGKIVIGGSFTSVGGATRNRIARLNASGTLDSSFDPNANGAVSALVLQTDGKIVVGGSFTSVGGAARNRVARLNADGTLDNGFDPNASSTVNTLALQPDGRILIGGSFGTLAGALRNRIARFNPDGTLDDNFDPNASSTVNTLLLQADGQVLVGGSFASLDGLPRNQIARLGPGSGPVLTLDDVAVSDAGSYAVIVSSPYGSVTSSNAVLTVNLPPFIVGQPLSGTVGEGSNTVLTVTASGTAPLFYQWFKEGAALAGAATTSYSVTNAQLEQAGIYTAVVSNTFGTATSLGATLVVQRYPPAITAQPQSAMVMIGSNVSFSVAATGTTLSYQWRKDGADIAGANAPGYSLTNLVLTDGGSYTVVITNPVGSVTSAVATLTVATPPAIAVPPTNQWRTVGSNATFFVTATGTPTLRYQWRRNGTNLVNGTRISGVTNPAVTLTAVTTNDSGNYAVVITNNYGAVTSGVAVLSVDYPPTARVLAGVVGWGTNYYGQTSVPSGLTNVVGLAAGYGQVVALRSNGRVVAWGDNTFGATNIPANVTNVVAVAAGGDFNLALKSDRTVVGWPTTFAGGNVPAGLQGVVGVAAGLGHSLAVKSDGTVVAWGQNDGGSAIIVPQGLSGVVAVAAGYYHNVVLLNDGSVTAWGNNGYGQTNVPTGLHDVVAVAAGDHHSLALKADGTVVAWGLNNAGQTNVPVGLDGVVGVSASWDNSMAVKLDGTVVIWGTNTYGQATVPAGLGRVLLGSEGSGFSMVYAQAHYGAIGGSASIGGSAGGPGPFAYQWLRNGTILPAQTNALLSLSALTTNDAGNYALAVTSLYGSVTSAVETLNIGYAPGIVTQPSNQLASAGSSVTFRAIYSGSLPCSFQWLRNGSVLAAQTDTVFTLRDVSTEDTGYYTLRVSSPYGTTNTRAAALYVGVPGYVATWGNNGSSQTNVPATVSNVLAVAGGDSHSLALTVAGKVVAWGGNTYGQASVPVGLSNVLAVAAGRAHSLVLKAAGTLASWGYSGSGLGSVATRLSNVVAVAAGGDNSLALRSDGTVAAWGDNSYGQTNVPSDLSGAVDVSAGYYHSLALRSDGTVVAWGYNNYGQTNVPAGLDNVVAVAAGYYHSLALKSDGTVVAWGYNNYGQTNVPIGLANVVAIAAGYYGNVALRSDGTVAAWGSNSYGLTNAATGLVSVAAIAAGGYHNLAVVNPDPPFIIRQPVSQVAALGTRISFDTSAIDSVPLYYQWRKSGTNLSNNARISGATNSVLTVSGVAASDAGDYSVVVSPPFGQNAITSGVATLTVVVPPAFLQQPASRSTNIGRTVRFVVVASGTAPLSYQWNKDGVDIPGANLDSYTLGSVQPGDSGEYGVFVKNAAGGASSADALLTVLPSSPPQLVAQLQSNKFVLSFPAEANFTYSALYATNLSDGVWLKFVDVQAETADRIVGLADAVSTNSPQRFYRVVTPALP